MENFQHQRRFDPSWGPIFNDPAWRDQSAKGLLSYIQTGLLPREWLDDSNWVWQPLERTVLANLIKKHRRFWARYLPDSFHRTEGACRTEIGKSGGIEEFLTKYGDS